MATRVLIVDDSPSIRAMHSFVLKSNGYEVETACDGLDAVEKLYSTDGIQVAVVDINMPKMDGLEFVKKIRCEEPYRDLPVIMLTSEGSEEDKKRGMEAGANVYMVKPSNGKDLVLQIQMLIGE